MSTPSIQTLITQAQQVLNLKSSNEIRATLAAILANANVGTPLNPNLTTQQLWDEFYEIVRQPSDDIMSIITDQMMRMVFTPPAPGGAGADKQVIFNDAGVLAGDAGLVYNKTTDALTVTGLVTAGSATITGAATVGTTLGVTGVSSFAAGTALLPALTTTGDTNTGIYYPAADTFAVTTGGTERYRVDSSGNLGIGVTPSAWRNTQRALQLGAVGTLFSSVSSAGATCIGRNVYESTLGDFTYIVNDEATFYEQTATGTHAWYTAAAGTGTIAFGSAKMTLDVSGNLLVGVTSANANGGVLQLKSGITFPATQVAASDANTLDDYEEGTWTPVVTSTAGTLTSVTGQTGTYTKIGRMVTVTGIFIITTNGTGSAGLSVAGLPFTNGALSNIGAGRVDGTTGNMTQVKINAATAIALISKYDNTYPAADGAYFPFTISYYV